MGYTDLAEEPSAGDREHLGFQLDSYFNLSPAGLYGWREWLRERGRFDVAEAADPFTPLDAAGFAARYDETTTDTAYVADAARQRLARQSALPELVLITFLRPHSPWVAPASLLDPRPVLQHAGRLMHSARDRARCMGRASYTWDETLESLLVGTPGYAEIRAVYAALVRELDTHLAALIRQIRATPQANCTMIMVTSDHGQQLGDGDLVGSRGGHRASHHVPMLIADPRQSACAEVNDITMSTAIEPTLREWFLGRPIPGSLLSDFRLEHGARVEWLESRPGARKLSASVTTHNWDSNSWQADSAEPRGRSHA